LRKFTLALLLIAAALFSGIAAPAAHAVPDPTGGIGTVSIDGTPLDPIEADGTHTNWTGYRFNSAYACVQNNIGTTWSIDLADNYLESGTATMILNDRFPAWGDQPCSVGYTDSQIILVGTYNEASTKCWHISGTSSAGRYTGHVTVAMNVSATSAVCRDTAQHRNYYISTALSHAVGLAQFLQCGAWTSSVNNLCYKDSYNFAGTDDRNSLYWRMRT
jgi:hypothetical protein